jgi:hypothetical protein
MVFRWHELFCQPYTSSQYRDHTKSMLTVDSNVKGIRTARLGGFAFGLILVLFCTDARSQWQQDFSLGSITCFGSIGPKLFVSATPGLMVSLDSGQSWSVALPRSHDTGVQSIVSVGSKLFAETQFGLLISSDSARSWSAANVDITDLHRIGSTLFGASTAIFRSTDSGATWLSSGFGGIWILDFCSAGDAIFASTSDSGVFRSTDGGASWHNVIPGSKGESYSDWHVATVGTIVLATASGTETAFLSDDFGNTWRPLTIPTPKDFNPGLEELLVVGTNIFAGYTDAAGGVTISPDTGRSWSLIGSMHRVNSLFEFGGYIFAGTNATGVFRASLSDLGVEGVASKVHGSTLSVTPNPTTSYVDISFDAPSTREIFDVFDALGRHIESGRIPTGATSYRLDVSSYSAGVYSVRIGTKTLRFVKR